MGATSMAIWSCMDCTLCDHRDHLWTSILYGVYTSNSVVGYYTVCIESRIQYCIHADSVWFAEFDVGEHRYLAGARNADSGDARHLPPRPLDYICQHPIPRLGLLCNGVADDGVVDE